MSIFRLFANLSVNKKLVLGFALVLLMTFFVTLAGMQSLERLTVRSEKMGAITKLHELVHQARVLRLQFEVSRGSADAQALEQHIGRIEQYIGELKLQFNKPQNLALMDQELAALSGYRKAFQRLQQEPGGAARQQILQVMEEAAGTVRRLSDELFAGQQRLRTEDIRFANALLIGIALVAFVFGVLAAWLITRLIVRPLAETLTITERIAQDDLSAEIRVERGDGIGQLQRNMQRMSGSLRELTRRAGVALASITDSVSNIQSMNLQIAAAAEQQSSRAEEINRSVVNVRDIAEQSSITTQQTAVSSVELARLGGELQTLVSRFRL